MKNFGTVVLTMFTVLILSIFVFGCADGDDGVDGITGPSGVDALTEETCLDGKVLETTLDQDGKTIILTCVEPS